MKKFKLRAEAPYDMKLFLCNLPRKEETLVVIDGDELIFESPLDYPEIRHLLEQQTDAHVMAETFHYESMYDADR